MKKQIFIIGMISLLLGTVLVQNETRSAADLKHEKPTQCTQVRDNAFQQITVAFDNQVQNIVEQERPTSELVDDVFESFRTYGCWLEYTCRTVLYSAGTELPRDENGNLDNIQYAALVNQELTEDHLGRIPGCVDPENVGLPSEWDKVLDAMISNFGDGTVNAPKGHFSYMPQCAENNIADANSEYQNCLDQMNDLIACTDPNRCPQQSGAVLKMQKALGDAAADKKSRAMETKLAEIANKMLIMEDRVNYLKSFIYSLDQEIGCLSKQCT